MAILTREPTNKEVEDLIKAGYRFYEENGKFYIKNRRIMIELDEIQKDACIVYLKQAERELKTKKLIEKKKKYILNENKVKLSKEEMAMIDSSGNVIKNTRFRTISGISFARETAKEMVRKGKYFFTENGNSITDGQIDFLIH